MVNTQLDITPRNQARCNLTHEEYRHILVSQDYKCPICKLNFLKKPRDHWGKVCIDHNHRNGKTRGVLCCKCNLMLGYIENKKPSHIKSDRWINAAKEYLERWK